MSATTLAVAAALWRMTSRAFQNAGAFFIQQKVCIYFRNFYSCYGCCNKVYVLLLCQTAVFFTEVCAICDNHGSFFLTAIPLKTVFQKLTVRIVVLFKLIIQYDRTILTDCFINICHISPMLLSCFFAERGIRIGGVLQNRRIHSAILFCFETPNGTFHNSLL